ncbi:MAG: hypothetical protein K0Q54_960 [Methylobacterium brachiatum]|jgi:hypothetical protein|nr:hypothetical protein [Methylobacterium brachiatum]
MSSRTEHNHPVTTARASDRRWLRLGIATLLGAVAGSMLFATEAKGRPEVRRR